MTRWLRCHEIGDGVFSDERTITICERGNGRVAFNVPKVKVREEDPAAVLVKVYKHSGGTWWSR
jgi:hypothetical protein